MTSTSLEAAVKLPDNDASNLHLAKLVSARDFSGPNLSSVAGDCLRNFCDAGLSVTRRRWLGIALTGVLEMPEVAAHIGALTEQLRNLGAIILSSTEQEQTKIVAGFIVRQALEQGIEYSRFWSSEKVRHSAPNFPLEADAGWMQNFQSFLDTLSDLALTKPSSEPSIGYLVSLSASDGFKWRESSNTFPVALIEASVMTIIAPDEHLRDCQFVEIPIEHILSTQPESSKLHNSQAQRTDHEPWDLVMTLKSQSWSYRLNSTQRIATDVTLMFKHSGDALEWEHCVKAHQRAHQPQPEVSRNLPIDASSPSIRHSHARKSLRSDSQPRRTERVTSKKLVADVADSSDAMTPRPGTETNRVGSHAPQEPRLQPESSTSKRTTNSKGKLPHVSQAAKQKIFRKLNSQDEDLDMLIGSKRKTHKDSSDLSIAASSPQKKSQSSKAVPGKKPPKSKSKPRMSHYKHQSDDDEDFVPSQTRPKKRTNPKRKATPDTIAEDKSTKKSRIQPNKGVKPTATGGKQPVQPRPLAKPRKPSSSVPSPQHTLIGGLLGVQRPAKISDVSFKKPTLPARVAQTPSTPTKPNRKLTGTPLRPQTPIEARRYSGDNALHYMASSPPVIEETEERNEWHEVTVEAAMLSSNSKPTPASPNAESTAISGHADREDVASEKKTGDWQTAKSDPFSRRSAGKKATSFIRRLIGEEPTDENVDPEIGISVRPPLQKWLREVVEIDANKAPSHDTAAAHYTTAEEVDVVLQQVPGVTDQAIQSPRRTLEKTQGQQRRSLQQSNDDTDEYTEHVGILQSSIALSKEKVAMPQLHHNESVAGNNMTVSTLAASQQIVESTQSIAQAEQQTSGATRDLIEGSQQYRKQAQQISAEAEQMTERTQQIFGETEKMTENTQQMTKETQQMIDETPAQQFPDEEDAIDEDDTLVGGGEDSHQAVNEFNASPVHFRSSPPRPGSSSSHSSTSAVREPLTDPPVPTSQAEEMDWEASLQPHQRDLHELLLRTSKRVMRHIVDNETSVDDIAEMYAQDGKHVLDTLIQRHETDYEHVFQEMESTKTNLRKDLERAAKQMAKDRKRVGAIA